MSINLGNAARDLRSRLGLSMRDAASQLGMSYAHLCNIENGKASPSPEIIEKFHDAWGIDLYMFAIVFHSDDRRTPKALRKPVMALESAWKKHIELKLSNRSRDGVKPCLTSVD